MSESSFFAYIDRMKYIRRWGLMRSSMPENVQEHSMQVAVLSHALAVIGRDICRKPLDPARIAAAALYHDCSEIFTGDLATPVKYKNDRLSGAYKEAELEAKRSLFDTLPEKKNSLSFTAISAPPTSSPPISSVRMSWHPATVISARQRPRCARRWTRWPPTWKSWTIS